MELSQLQYFLTVADEENLSAAARRLYLSQPALSRAISRLERELGTPLFDRTGNRISLNENGKLFAYYVNRAKLELNNGIRLLRQQGTGDAGSVTVASTSHGLLAEPCAEYLLAHPGLHLYQLVRDSRQQVELLADQAIDFCVTCARLPLLDVLWESVVRDEFLVCVPSAHPLAGRGWIDLTELAGERVLFCDYGLETGAFLQELYAMAGFAPDLFFSGSEDGVPFSLLSQGLGVCLIPASAYYARRERLLREHPGQFSVLRIRSPRQLFVLGIATLRGRALSPAADGFLRYLRDYFTEQGKALAEALEQDFPL